MKKSLYLSIVLIGLFICPNCYLNAQGVGINSSGNPPDSSAILDASSNNKGMLIPRLSTTERDAISNPATGLLIFNTTTNCINMWQGSSWKTLCGDSGGGSNLNFTMSLSSSIASVNNTVSSTSFPITITLGYFNGTTAGVGFNLTGVPAGVTYSLTPGGCFPSCSSTLTFTGTNANLGTYPLTLTAIGGGSTQTAFITLYVTTSGSSTFNYTGSQQTFTVPSGVAHLNIKATGAQGGGTLGGLGGWTQADFGSTPSQVLYVFVGGQGSAASSTGGYNGGGNGTVTSPGGGGASDVRAGSNSYANVIIVGGGGGGGNGYGGGAGGGGTAGVSSANQYSGGSGGVGWSGNGANGGLYGGAGGSSSHGGGGGGGGFLNGGSGGCATGYGSYCGTTGTAGQGGNGNYSPPYCTNQSPGGGGGYYGGGGGDSGNCGGSGAGGGSSVAVGAVNVVFSGSSGAQIGNGQVIITW